MRLAVDSPLLRDTNERTVVGNQRSDVVWMRNRRPVQTVRHHSFSLSLTEEQELPMHEGIIPNPELRPGSLQVVVHLMDVGPTRQYGIR